MSAHSAVFLALSVFIAGSFLMSSHCLLQLGAINNEYWAAAIYSRLNACWIIVKRLTAGYSCHYGANRAGGGGRAKPAGLCVISRVVPWLWYKLNAVVIRVGNRSRRVRSLRPTGGDQHNVCSAERLGPWRCIASVGDAMRPLCPHTERHQTEMMSTGGCELKLFSLNPLLSLFFFYTHRTLLPPVSNPFS